jgi:formylglycine-generating enzyme
MDLVYIEPGQFTMGSPEDEKNRRTDEGPRHQVEIKECFWMGRFEVTNSQFRLFKPDHDSGNFEGESLNENQQPVVQISWEDAKGFVDWASLRLPSEAQWEYACRAGSTTVRYWGDGEKGACACANVADRRLKSQKPVLDTFDCDDGFLTAARRGSFAPNGVGLYDMLGNVWEWCADAWVDSYVGAPVDGSPRKGDPGAPNVCRGGSWINAPDLVRSAFRGFNFMAYRGLCLGKFLLHFNATATWVASGIWLQIRRVLPAL